MKIIFSLEALNPSLTGIGRYTWELAQQLPHHPKISDVQFYRDAYKVKDPSSLVKPISEGVKAFNPKKYPRWLRDWQMSIACKGKLIHGPNFFLPKCADYGVITVHDLSVFKFPELHPLERVAQFERDFSRSVTQSAHIITDSQNTQKEVMEFTGLPSSRVTAIALGVADVYKPHAVQELIDPLHKYGLSPGCYALCVSTLEPRKKIDCLIDAWRELPSALRTTFPLILIGGSGWLSQLLQSTIATSQAEGWIKLLGYVPESDLPYLYAGATVFVYPSTYEGFGLPPIEAMASGVPIVVSDQSCLPEVTRGAGLMIDPDDTSAFSAALEKSMTDTAWRETAIAAGLHVASGYTWQKCVDQTVAVYQKIMSS